MRLTTLFVSRTKQIYAKTLTVLERQFKIYSILLWMFSKILLTSTVICKQTCSHKNEIKQYLQNYKFQNVNQGNFRKPLLTSTNSMKNDHPKTAQTFFTGHSVLSYFLLLNCYKFPIALTKSIKLRFLKSSALASQNRLKFRFLW